MTSGKIQPCLFKSRTAQSCKNPPRVVPKNELLEDFSFRGRFLLLPNDLPGAEAPPVGVLLEGVVEGRAQGPDRGRVVQEVVLDLGRSVDGSVGHLSVAGGDAASPDLRM